MLKIKYFEISNDDFDAQMLMALRFDEPLLFFIQQDSVSPDHWNRVIRLADTKDIFSVLNTDQICSIIDPLDYHKDKYKIRCTV